MVPKPGEADHQTSTGMMSSRDLPTPAPTDRTRSSSVSGDFHLWRGEAQCPASRKRKALRLLAYTSLPSSTIVRALTPFDQRNLLSPEDEDELLQNVPEAIRPLSKEDMARRVKSYAERNKSTRRSSAMLAPDTRDDDQKLHPNDGISEPSAKRLHTPSATESGDTLDPEVVVGSPYSAILPGEKKDERILLVDSDMDLEWAQVVQGLDFDHDLEKIDFLTSGVSEYLPYHQPGLSQGGILGAGHFSANEFLDFPGLDAALLRQVLPSQEYDDTYVHECCLVLDDAFFFENEHHRMFEYVTNQESPYSNSFWEHASEWRALPFRGILLPSDFLHIDEHRRSHGSCLEGFEAHENQMCLCALDDADLAKLWVTPEGLSSKARRILQTGEVSLGDTEDYDPFGNTVFHFLAARGSPQVLFKALDMAKDVSPLNSGHQTFLHCLGPSWLSGDISALQCLLKYLARISFAFFQRDLYGQTVFHVWARSLDHLENLFSSLPHQNFLLTWTKDAFDYQPSTIRLVDDGVLLSVPSIRKERKSPLEIFLYPPSPDSTTAISLHKESADTTVNVKHLFPFIAAIFESNKPDVEDGEGRNALHCLAACDLDMGNQDGLPLRVPNIQATDIDQGFGSRNSDEKRTLFGSDVVHLRNSLAELFLSRGVDVNAYNSSGNTVLMEFVLHSQYEDDVQQPSNIFEILLNNHANIDARNRDGETALHIAAKHFRRRAVQTLVSRGANIHARNKHGQSILQVLTEKIGKSGGRLNEYAPLETFYAWLSGESIRASLKPSTLDEWSCPNLETSQPAPSCTVKLLDDIMSHFKNGDATRHLSTSIDAKDEMAIPEDKNSSHQQDCSRLNTDPTVKIETRMDVESPGSSIFAPRIEGTVINRICEDIIGKVFGASLQQLPNPEAILQTVASCIDNIASLIDPDQSSMDQDEECVDSFTECGSNHGPGSSQNQEYTSPSHVRSPNRFKKRKHQEDDDDDSQEPEEGQPGGSGGGRVPPNNGKDENQQFPCPYRKRNPARFNARDHYECSKSFSGMTGLKAHIRAWHLKSSDVQVAKDHCCPLCNRPFQSQEELKAHLRNEARVCESNPPPKGTNDAVVDPEDGINSDEASVLAARKIKHKIADWHSLWRHLFVNDDKVPLPTYEPIIDFYELKREFDRACNNSKVILGQILETGPSENSVDDVYDKLINNILNQCKQHALAAPPRKRRRSFRNEAASPASGPSSIGTRTMRDPKLLPTPARSPPGPRLPTAPLPTDSLPEPIIPTQTSSSNYFHHIAQNPQASHHTSNSYQPILDQPGQATAQSYHTLPTATQPSATASHVPRVHAPLENLESDFPPDDDPLLHAPDSMLWNPHDEGETTGTEDVMDLGDFVVHETGGWDFGSAG